MPHSPSRHAVMGSVVKQQCCCLSSYEGKALEVYFLLLAALVCDAQLGSCHTAKLVACVDNGVILAVVQQAHLAPSAIDKEFKAEVLCNAVHAKV